MRSLLALLVAVACSAGIVTIAAAQSDDTRLPKGSSVGNGLGGAPPIATTVKAAARSGKCKVRSFKSEGFKHGIGASFTQVPAVSGTHNARWADWGIYETAVPPQFQVHNLEHGGVVLHFGRSTPDSAAEPFAELFATEPGYLIITPRASNRLTPAEGSLRRFPERGFAVTSWQRRLVCPSASKKAIRAATTFIRRYRGTGPEQVPAFNSSTPRPAELPAPAQASEPPA